MKGGGGHIQKRLSVEFANLSFSLLAGERLDILSRSELNRNPILQRKMFKKCAVLDKRKQPESEHFPFGGAQKNVDKVLEIADNDSAPV
jgi:hypothetical protein